MNLALRPELRSLIKGLFYFKLFLLLLTIILCVVSFRFFCVVLCPLGAIYGLFNRFGFLRLQWLAEDCFQCKLCEKICPLGLKIPEELDSGECIRCLRCLEACPTHGIKLKFLWNTPSLVDEKRGFAKSSEHAQGRSAT